MKKILAAAAFSVAALTFAQETPVLEKQIKNYTGKVDSIVIAEKIKMNVELDEVDSKFSDGKISEAEKQNQRTLISERYEQSINEKVNAEKDELDQITRDAVKAAVMNAGNEEGLKASSKSVVTVKWPNEKSKHPKDLVNTSDLMLSAGFLTLTNEDAPFNFFNNKSEVRLGQSMSWSLTYRGEKQLGKFKSPVFFNYGLGYRGDGYDLGAGRVFAQTPDHLYIAPFEAGNIKYSTLQVHYLEVPVGINFVLNPKYVEFEGTEYLDATKNQLRVGLGIYGGVKVGNRIKYRYSNDVSNKIVVQERVSDGVNPFLFGGKFSVGYGGINLFLKKDFTPVFEKSTQLNNKYGLQFGIELMNFSF